MGALLSAAWQEESTALLSLEVLGWEETAVLEADKAEFAVLEQPANAVQTKSAQKIREKIRFIKILHTE